MRYRSAFFYLVLVLVPLIGSLALGEAMVRWLAPQELSGTWLTYGPRGLVLNKAGAEARHQQGDLVVRYRFNSAHQRGPEPDPRSRGVLVLGDSFTFGWMLEEPESYVGRLQAQIDRQFGNGRYQLQNAATAGWGMGDYLAYLEAFGDRLAPKLVVVFVNFDDVDRAVRAPLYSLASDGSAVGQDLGPQRLWLKLIIDRIPGYAWLLERSHLVQLIRSAILQAAGRAPPAAAARPAPAPPPAPSPLMAWPTLGTPLPQSEDLRSVLAAALMSRLRSWCEQRGTPLLVMTTGWGPVTDYPWMPGVARGLGAAPIDLSPEVAQTVWGDRRIYHSVDGHPTARAAEIIARAAWPPLQRVLMALEP